MEFDNNLTSVHAFLYNKLSREESIVPLEHEFINDPEKMPAETSLYLKDATLCDTRDNWQDLADAEGW
jgi:hypothetical protein